MFLASSYRFQPERNSPILPLGPGQDQNRLYRVCGVSAKFGQMRRVQAKDAKALASRD